MSEKNITTLSGNNIDITIRNKHGIANGILVQDSDKAFVNLNSINSNSLTVISENSDSIGIDTADGNINFNSSNGSNTIKAITKMVMKKKINHLLTKMVMLCQTKIRLT